MKINWSKITPNDFLQNRIPAQDALEAFVANGKESEEWIKTSRKVPSRWYPVKGGHRVLLLYQGQSYDESRFKLSKGAWDHEHCMKCGENIKPMSLCWVTQVNPYILLCEGCFNLISKCNINVAE